MDGSLGLSVVALAITVCSLGSNAYAIHQMRQIQRQRDARARLRRARMVLPKGPAPILAGPCSRHYLRVPRCCDGCDGCPGCDICRIDPWLGAGTWPPTDAQMAAMGYSAVDIESIKAHSMTFEAHRSRARKR